MPLQLLQGEVVVARIYDRQWTRLAHALLVCGFWQVPVVAITISIWCPVFEE